MILTFFTSMERSYQRKIEKKSWGPFAVCLLNSTANSGPNLDRNGSAICKANRKRLPRFWPVHLYTYSFIFLDTALFYFLSHQLCNFSDNWLDCLYATFMAICITDIYVGTSVSWPSNICPLVWWKPTRLWALYISHGTLYLPAVNPRSNPARWLASTRMATIVTKTTRMG